MKKNKWRLPRNNCNSSCSRFVLDDRNFCFDSCRPRRAIQKQATIARNTLDTYKYAINSFGAPFQNRWNVFHSNQCFCFETEEIFRSEWIRERWTSGETQARSARPVRRDLQSFVSWWRCAPVSSVFCSLERCPRECFFYIFSSLLSSPNRDIIWDSGSEVPRPSKCFGFERFFSGGHT